MEPKEKPHYGRPIVTITSGAIYVRCPRLHLIERIPVEQWQSHWLHDKVWQPWFLVECAIDTQKEA